MWILAVAIAGSVPASGDERAAPLALNEATPHGSTTRVRIELKAQGLFRPGSPPGGASADARMPKPLELDIKMRLIFAERIVGPGRHDGAHPATDGQLKTTLGDPRRGSGSVKAVRHIIEAASAINGEVRPTSASIRPEVSLLVAQRREAQGRSSSSARLAR